MTTPRFDHRPPPYPVRREPAIAAALAQLRDGDWARLEGCPELEADLATWHDSDPDDRAPIPWYVTSGTAALEAILVGHGIGPGDEVITTPCTWAATVAAVLAVGAVPVFADVDPVTGLIDPATVPPLIGERTRAVLAVHLFGHPVDCPALRAICADRDLLFLEDGSQAHGARLHGRRVGDWGDAAAFSCMGLKPLAGTEGGYALFRDRDAAEAAALYGRHPRGLADDARTRLGDAGLLDALQMGWRPCAVGGALVRAQLPHLDDDNAARRANVATLREGLAGCDFVHLPAEAPGAEGVYHLCSFVFDADAAGCDRASYLAALKERGVDAFVYIPTPIHRLRRLDHAGYDGPRVIWHEQLVRAGVDYRRTSCPGAEERCERSFEMAFNWTEPAPEAMRALATCLTTPPKRG